MPSFPKPRAASALLASALFATFAFAQKTAHAPDMTSATPESVGFSSERLERLHDYIKQLVDQKHLAGAVTILARHGKIIDSRTYGESDMALHKPIANDTIFRAYSMTKPTTGVAMMILYEQGKWLPSDPISKFIPEFKNLKVYKGLDSENRVILADPDHAPTMRELMTHSAGFSYGGGSSPVDALYKQLDPSHSANSQEMIDSSPSFRSTTSPATDGFIRSPWILRATSSRSSAASRSPTSTAITSSRRSA